MMNWMAIVLLNLGLVLPAQAIESRDVELRLHQGGRFWLAQNQDDLQIKAVLVGASEEIVDRIESLDLNLPYRCSMKYRKLPTATSGGFNKIMVYGIGSCDVIR